MKAKEFVLLLLFLSVLGDFALCEAKKISKKSFRPSPVDIEMAKLTKVMANRKLSQQHILIVKNKNKKINICVLVFLSCSAQAIVKAWAELTIKTINQAT